VLAVCGFVFGFYDGFVKVGVAAWRIFSARLREDWPAWLVLRRLAYMLRVWRLGCGAVFGAGVGLGPGFAFVGGLVFFEADVVVVEDEVFCAGPVAFELGGRLVEVGPVIAVEGEIAASAGLPFGHDKTGVELSGRGAGGVDD